MNSRRLSLRWALVLAATSGLISPASGQVVPTGGTAIAPSAGLITIPASLGTQSGANLFHSFSQFDVASGNTALFTATGLTTPMMINNIIARINSATPSMINGGIEVDTSGMLKSANLFLINPNGVIFGNGASVSVPGDFVVSTANYVTLGNGGTFYSDPANAASGVDNLTSFPIESFGFFKGATPASVTVKSGATLSAGKSLQFVTGDFTAQGGVNLSVSNSVLGIFSGGQVKATVDATVPYLAGAVTDYSTEANFTGHGAVTLGTTGGTGATLAATGTGGAVVIRGGHLVQVGTGASLAASSKVAVKADSFDLSGSVSATTPTGTVGIDTTGTMTMTGGTITAQGGSISLGSASLTDLTLDSASSIKETLGSGGTLNITSTGTVANGGTISTVGSTDPLQISALTLALTGTLSTGASALGVDTTGDVTLASGKITSTAGAITLGGTSLEDLMLDSGSSITETAGAAGTLTINATGTITNAGTILTVGSSNALAITSGAMSLSGLVATGSGALNVDSTGTVSLTGNGAISSNTNIVLGHTHLGGLSLGGTSSIISTGNSVSITATGNVALTGGTIEATGAGSTTVNSGGNISLTGGLIETMTMNATAGGALNVTDSAGSITLTQAAQIASFATGSGKAGDVTINGGVEVSHGAATTLTITGTGLAAFSNSTQTGQAAFNSGTGREAPNTGIFSFASGTGDGGSVNVTATGSVAITAGGQIASIQSNGAGGNAGGVALAVEPNTFFESSTVNTVTLGGVTSASGATAVPIIPVMYASAANPLKSTGAISINALSSAVTLTPGAAIQTSTQDGRAGDIDVFIGALTLDSYTDIQSLMSQTNTIDTATSGRTGNIDIEAFNFNFDILSSNFGFSGPISIASNAFIQTVANPRLANASHFAASPVGNVTVYAGSLTEGGTSVTSTDGVDFDYQITNDTQILAVNNATLNGANGADTDGSVTPLVQNLISFPANPSSTTLPTPPPGMGIVLDGTLNGSRDGQLLSIAPTYDAPTYTYLITPADGTTSGNNLFLSFAQFDLGINHPDSTNPAKTGFVDETVEFSAPGIANVLARITDQNPSDINGEIAEEAGTNANIFLFNPAGVVFGNHATLYLAGALTLSTADESGMNGTGTNNSGTFATQLGTGDDVGLTTASTSFSGAVQDFVFGTGPLGSVTISSKLITGRNGNGQIQVIAGPVNLSGALLDATQTLLFSAASSGTLTFPQTRDSLATFPGSFTSAGQVLAFSGDTLGTVSVSSGSVITVPSPNEASTILVRANEFDLTNSLIVDQTTGQSQSLAGQVLIDVTGPANITTTSTQNSFISTSTLGGSNGGSVQINAASLDITGGQSGIATTGIFSTAQPAEYYSSDVGYVPYNYFNPAQGLDPANATGKAGSISLNIGGTIAVTTFAQISASTTGYGDAGTITITGPAGVAPSVTLSGGSSITSSTFIDSNNHSEFTHTGAAGTVSLTASSLLVTGTQTLIATSAGTAVDTASPTDDGGDITIAVDGANGPGTGDVIISSLGQISGSSFTNGAAGTVTITQSGSTDLVDPATNPTTNGGIFLSSGGSISTAANGVGTASPANANAGGITLNTQALSATGAGSSINSSTAGVSKAGDITITGVMAGQAAQWVQIGIAGKISSDTAGTGNGGAIVITSGALQLNQGTISTSSTAGSGNGGSIGVTVAGHAAVIGSTGDVILNGGSIDASSNTTGEAGTVTIAQSGSLDLADPATNPTVIGGVYVHGGSISTEALGIGTAATPNTIAGNITLNTQALTLDANGTILSSTAGISKGGDITVNGVGGSQPSQFVVVKTGLIDSNTNGSGNGGTISIQTGGFAINDGAIAASANSGTGSGGSVSLAVTGNPSVLGATGDVAITNGSIIAALSSTTGDAGTVAITQSGSRDITGPALNPANNGGLYMNDALILTEADGIGTATPTNVHAGDITINIEAFTLTNGSVVISGTSGLSKGGDITINGVTGAQATTFVRANGGSQISSDTAGTGAGGAISIFAGALAVDGTGATISTNADGASTNLGAGGSIAITVTGNPAAVGSSGDVVITNGGTISASSGTKGLAGTVTITQSGSGDITNPALNPATNGGLFLNNGSITTAADGPGAVTLSGSTAGNIGLNVEALTATGSSAILSSTAGASKAGDVTIGGPTGNTQFFVLQNGSRIASETSGAGNGGTITMGTDLLRVDGATISTSATGGTGNGGDIGITAISPNATGSFVNLQNGGTIASSSATSGSAGMITIDTSEVDVDGTTSAISTDAGSVGNSSNRRGEISLTGGNFNLTHGGRISATTGGLSQGGTITVAASNEVSLSDNAALDASSTALSGGGNGGSILIGSDPAGPILDIGHGSPLIVTLTDGATISCDSQNTNGGNIGIQTGQLILQTHGLISTSEPNGPVDTQGGDITIRAVSLVYLNNYSFINSNAGQGTGGNITIDPQFVILNHSGINAIGGAANGNVFISSEYVLSSDSSILATGVVDINSLPLDLTGSLIPLPAELSSEEKRLREKCARAVNHEFSSFIVVGRGGTESAPEELQPDFGLDQPAR